MQQNTLSDLYTLSTCKGLEPFMYMVKENVVKCTEVNFLTKMHSAQQNSHISLVIQVS